MDTVTTQDTPDTSTTATTQTTTGGLGDSTQQAPATQAPPVALDFIPEQYRSESWATKYKSADDFFKGIDNLTKLAGKKEVSNGLQVPSENASPEELSKFYQALGRPEAADKYSFGDDLKGYDGMNLDEEKKGFSEVAFNLGLSQKQADAMFKVYVDRANAQFGSKQDQVKQSFDKAVTAAFGDDYKASLDMAKRGAKALNLGDTLDNEGLSANPIVLKLCAELGKYVGEDSFINPQDSGSGESLKEEAVRLQKSALYQKGDAATLRRVEEIYKRLYPN